MPGAERSEIDRMANQPVAHLPGLQGTGKSTRKRIGRFCRDYEYFVSETFIRHVSLASKGRNRLQNTHPFVRTFHSHEVVSSQV